MQLTPFGFKLPDLNDKDWWSQLYFNIVRGSGHTHNGVDSALLSASSLSKVTQSVPFAGWGGEVDGVFKKTIEVPVGINLTHLTPIFFVDGGDDDGLRLSLEMKKLTNTTFEVYSNDSALNLKVLYV